MNKVELIGFSATVLDLLRSDKRSLAWELLDHLYDKAKSLQEFDTLGQLCLETDYRDLHLKCAETAHAIAFTGDQKRASRNNLISAYLSMNYPEKAEYLVDIQLAQTPIDYDSLTQKAACLSLTNRKDDGEKIILDLLQKFPEKKRELQSMLSGKYLREGKLTEGVRVFVEAFKPQHKMFEQELRMKRWDGIPRPGRTIYVDGEGGIGDEIINIRFFENIKKLGMNPILFSHDNKFYRDKNNLFRRHGYKVQTESITIDKKQFWIPMMSFPAVLSLEEKDLWSGAYLSPLKNAKNKTESKRFKIGIKCSGNPYFAQDEYRKISLESMLKYLPENVDIYYIDKLKVNNPRVIDLADKIESWEDTLDLIDEMDCIVSSCTSLVHAAGAIGKTTFVAVPIAEYYIWTTSRRDNSSPWYSKNFYVMKQVNPRDWHHPLLEISEHVHKLMEKKCD
jgi:hypothetical protein